jgi:hypothetical protein
MVVLLLCGGSSGDVVHATGPYSNNNKNPPTPRDAKRSSRRRKDRHARDPPVSSVLVQSKGSDSVTHDTTFCRTENEDGGEELESLTYGSRHDGSSVSPLPPIVENDGSSDGSLTEEDDEDLQLLLIPKAVDRNDFHHNHGATPSSSSLMPVMELLVRTVLDDPTVPLSKSSCFDAVLKCGKDRAEIHRLRQQIRELQQQQQQQQKLASSTTKTAPVGEGTMYYEVRDLSALRSKRNGKMEAELRLRQSILRCWSPSSLSSKDDDEEEEQEHLPNDMLRSDYSCIIPLDTKRNAVAVPSGKCASTPPKHNPVTRKHFPSSGSETSTLPTAVSSETSEASVGPDGSVATTEVRIEETTKPIDEQDATAHVSVRLFI